LPFERESPGTPTGGIVDGRQAALARRRRTASD
jgi:hypothetical protein